MYNYLSYYIIYYFHIIGKLSKFKVENNDNVGDLTRIYTDGWEGYINLPNLNFDHHRINHRRGFG